MEIRTTGCMERYAKSLKYFVIYPDKTTKFYKSLRQISVDIDVDYTTISRKLKEDNPCICISQLTNYIFMIRKM
jgi:hypothetical protein|tara:strand:+ start:18294 stop:18515 length:222 start_codon:yes stop_codon:yes gene_type:complete